MADAGSHLIVTITSAPAERLVRVAGALDVRGAERLMHAIGPAAGHGRVVLDLQGVTAVDAAGVEALADAYLHLERRGAAVLCRLPSDARLAAGIRRIGLPESAA